MILPQEARDLLQRTPPFDRLEEEGRALIERELSTAYYPTGHVIIRQGGPAAEHLSIVTTGKVKVFLTTNENEDVLVDHRGPGDTFGMLSLLRADRAVSTVMAVEDTTCFRVGKETILSILAQNAAFSDFYLRFYLTRLVDLMHRQIQDRSLLYGGGDKMLFTHRLDELTTKEIVRLPSTATIQDAAELMSRHRISSLLLTDESGYPSGIVTDRDLRERVVAQGKGGRDPVGSIMSVTLIKSEAKDFCFEALLKMVKFNIHHLLVARGGELTGIITNHDLMMLQSTYPLAIANDIGNQRSVEGLAVAQRAIDRLIAVLIREGARASTVTRIITEVNDRLVRRLLEIVEERLGPPPASYCWIAFGSEGRKEQTFRTDQDNAIIYENPAPGEEGRVEQYFAGLAGAMQDGLSACGFPPCPAGYMASNPRWRGPLAAWKDHFRRWINTPTPEAVLFSLIFFDFRPVHGNALLAENLRATLSQALKGSGLFLTHMAAIALRNRAPIGAFGRLRTERKGPHRGTVNVKLNALAPIVDSVRLAALEAHLYSTSTLERLRDLPASGSFLAPAARDLEEAFEFLMGLRLRHQQDLRQKGESPDNFIEPGVLGLLERRALREVLRLVKSVQRSVGAHYRSGMVQ